MPQPLLKNPFVVDWQQTNNENGLAVLKAFTESLGSLRPRQNAKKFPKTTTTTTTTITTKTPNNEQEEKPKNLHNSVENEEKSFGEQKQSDEFENTTAANLDSKTNFTKKYFVFGMSKILRELERRRLTVAIFDRNLLKQPAVAYHIGTLCINSGAFCSCLENLSASLSSVLNVRSVGAVGIIRTKGIDSSQEENDGKLSTLIETIKNSLKPVLLRDSIENKERKLPNKKRNSSISQGDYVTPSVVQPLNFGKKRSKKDKANAKKPKLK